MKKVIITGVHKFLGKECHKKQYIYGELPKKGSMDNLKGTWQKIGRRVFLREVDTSMNTMA